MNPIIPQKLLRDSLCKACYTHVTRPVVRRITFARPVTNYQEINYLRSHAPGQSIVRPFSSSQSTQKKKKQKEAAARTDLESDIVPPEQVVDDAFDFVELDTGVARNLEKLKDSLSRLKPGGRLDTEVIESLRVSIGGQSGTQKLGDLATVVPKGGRTISIIVAEDEVHYPIYYRL